MSLPEEKLSALENRPRAWRVINKPAAYCKRLFAVRNIIARIQILNFAGKADPCPQPQPRDGRPRHSACERYLLSFEVDDDDREAYADAIKLLQQKGFASLRSLPTPEDGHAEISWNPDDIPGMRAFIGLDPGPTPGRKA